MQVEQYDGVIGGEVSRRVMATRLVTGLVQGLLLYWLYRASRGAVWPATEPYLFMPLLLLALLLPPVLILSLGHMTSRRVAQWTGTAAIVLLVLALHEAWRSHGVDEFNRGFVWVHGEIVLPSSSVPFAAMFLYIAHALVMAGTTDGKRIASYGSYFEIAWKLAVQLLFSAFFVGALWAMLRIGGGLFELVKLDFLKRLQDKSWFVMPVFCFAFSCALHITDVRPAIVRGIRTLLLVLASWILPVAVVIIGGFLCTLPFTGLDNLWKTRYATSLLLTTVTVLVVLINCAFQNGQTAASLAIRIAARMAAILLLPLTGIAIYALGLRVHEYGWTADRIEAAACLLVASCYAIGYQWAAHRYETWLVEIAPVNVGTAFVVLAVLLALFTPLADPARLAVNHQMARLEKGLVTADQFDYRYLRFDGQRYGQEALARLARQGVGAEPKLVSERAALALALKERWRADTGGITATTRAANIIVWPATETLPASFIAQQWKEPAGDLPSCLIDVKRKCDAFLLDPDGDGQLDVLLVSKDYSGNYLFSLQPDGAWVQVARADRIRCKSLAALRAGNYTLDVPRFKALNIGGVQFQFESMTPYETCDDLMSAP
jgi:hypothetical protein